ncbi:CbbQ/NirQ/NorQ/GpvN family protein [Nocardioides sp. BP30]|uniref:CbbQ/NirQ/NorQ/GpvN family protein n=1 Tax=Nocardioides sp. BP30 TaxID=3036374 RepID=UPI0024698DDE|nr:CbbQ/NirQ/NorQ/GpvN family protein [Nocardioides sp. BP30]WGL52475.1 CbbQ/NirQ/NorQ/GpvN family protein [Nocardioides sp. BP30]
MTQTVTPSTVDAPFYLPVRDEVELFEAAYEQRIPVLLKGPTGCGKTRFVEHMVWRLLGRRSGAPEQPLITVSCHDDLTSADLVGRYLLSSEGTTWLDGPLTQAVRTGAICYLDEVVEARKDTTVILHALTDHRRILPVERLGTTIEAHPDFLLVVSYNPGYQATAKDLKPSTRQRFMAIEFTYPERDLETRIITHEAHVDETTARDLAFLGEQLRRLDEAGVIEGPSTRLLVHVGGLITRGIAPRRACDVGLVQALSDDPDVQEAVTQVVEAVFPA